MITIRNLNKTFDKHPVLEDLDVNIPTGSIYGLIGTNGAGKTTTVRMLTCLTNPTGGRVEILGHDVVSERDLVKSLVGVSPQDTAVAENLTVRENLEFIAALYLPKDKIKAAVDRTVKVFGLKEYENKKAKILSGGNKRKISIAMATIGEPKILFLDEPTLGLDVLARRQLWREIEELKKDTTIILTTHYMEEAQELADRIVIMTEGKVRAVGTLEELEARTGKKGLEEVFVSIAEA